jgi:hypothetical protein
MNCEISIFVKYYDAVIKFNYSMKVLQYQYQILGGNEQYFFCFHTVILKYLHIKSYKKLY